MKRENNLQSTLNHASDAAEWKKEIGNLRKTALTVWHELLMLESFYCLEGKDRVDFFEEVRRFEIRLIKRALFHAGGSQRKSARLLGISNSNLNNKIKRYRIPVSTALRKVSLTDS